MLRLASKFSRLSSGILEKVSSKNLLSTIKTQQSLRKSLVMMQKTSEHTKNHQFSTSSHLQTILSSMEQDIKIKEESLTEYLFPRFDSFGNKPALVEFLSGRTMSYAELKESVIKTASALNRLGYKKGDIMTVFAANCPEYAIFLLACAFSGIVMTSANPSHTPSELCRHLTHSESCALVVHQPLIKTAKAALERDTNLRTTIKIFVSNGKLFTKLYDKRDDFDFRIVNFPFISSNIPESPAYGVYISQLIRYARACSLYGDFVGRCKSITAKLVEQGYTKEKLKVTDIIVIGEADGCRPFSRLLEDDGKSFPENVDINPVDDTVVMPYSSGTTGLPKGVMSTHMNLVSNLQQFRTLLRVTPEDTGLGILPFYHCYGMIVVMLGILQDGGKLVTLPKFDPETYMKALMTQKVSQLHIVPPILLFMARHPMVSKFDLSSLKRVVCGAAPLRESITEEFVDRINAPVTQGFGMTETSTIVTLDTVPHTPGSAGILIPNTQAKVVCPETDKELEIGNTGELCFKGQQIMKGYYKNEKATTEMIRDGWLYSGDIGNVDKKGHFFVTERIKDLIKFKGYQVAPAELEDLLLTHPGVQDAAVIGVPDKRAGEIPRAYIVPKADQQPTEQELLVFVEENVAPFKKLSGGVVFIGEIPKSPSGKILRKILKDKLAQN